MDYLTFATILSLLAWSSSPTSADPHKMIGVSCRLSSRPPKTVAPTRYELALRLDTFNLNTRGRVEIDLRVLPSDPQDAEPAPAPSPLLDFKSCLGCEVSQTHIPSHYDTISMLADESLNIESINYVRFDSNGLPKKIRVLGYCRDEWFQLVSIKLNKRLVPGSRGRLTINYKGKLLKHKPPTREITKSDNELVHKLTFKYSLPKCPRKLFPHFDDVMARFKLTLIHERDVKTMAAWAVGIGPAREVSDRPNVYRQISYNETMQMSSFLMASYLSRILFYAEGSFSTPIDQAPRRTVSI